MSYHPLFLCHRDNGPPELDADLWKIRRRIDERGITYKSLRAGGDGTFFLNLSGTAITKLGPLVDLPVTHLCLQGCYGIRDFTPLSDMDVVWLNLCRTRIRNLSPLAHMPLEYLDIRRTRVTDLRPLRNTPLKSLDLRFTEIVDVSTLGCLPLETLSFYPGRITAGLDTLRGIRSLATINRRSAEAFWERNEWRIPDFGQSSKSG